MRTAAASIRTAVTMCIQHGITPDLLAQLIAERQAEALQPRKPNPPRKSVHQEALAAVLTDAGAEGSTVTELGHAIGLRAQNVRSQLLCMERKGTAAQAKLLGSAARWFASQALATAWMATPPEHSPAPNPQTVGKREQILQLASTSPDGITARDVEQLLTIGRNAAHAHVTAMQGRTLFRGQVIGYPIRHFISAELASEWVQRTVAATNVDRGINTPAPVKPAKAAPVTLGKREAPAFTEGPAVIPEGVRITRCPAPLGRFEVAANELTGGFSKARPGINPLTGKAWA